MSISRPGELRCGEYSFKLNINPWQHPIFDENIHRLLTLLTALCRGCGGVVYLMTDDIQPVEQEIFHHNKERLYELFDKSLESFPQLTEMFQVSLLLGEHRSWAALLQKRSYDKLEYRPVKSKILKPISFEMDMFGQMHTKSIRDTQGESNREMETSSATPDQTTETATLLQTYSQETHQNEPETSCASAVASVKVPGPSVGIVSPKVDFSSCQRLDWAENTKDWQKYVKIKEMKTDEIVASCPIWTPTQPMKITPDRHSIRYLFDSEKDMDEIMHTVATKGPGCAVTCRTWRFHIHVSDDNMTDKLPPGHICDILTVTDTGRLSFWVIVDRLKEEVIQNQIDYLMITGRMLKYQIAQKGEGADLSNLWIHCCVLPVDTSHCADKAVKLRLSECQEVQAHLDHMYQDTASFELLQRTLTKIILSKESPLKRCVGDRTSITLSAQQLAVLMRKAKVNYITGPAGSGKSYTGASLCKMYGKERSVYICTTTEFLEYLKFNGCTGILVRCDQDLFREIKSGTFDNKVCIVIDDCHKFTCTKKSMKKLFNLLRDKRDMSLFVFADNDYQSFDRRQQQVVHDCILDLTRTVLKEVPLNFPLTEIYRNTRKVVSFVQAAIQDVQDDLRKIEAANTEDGEGVECIPISNVWENNPDNDLVVYLRSLLLSGDYTQSEIAILLESSYTTDKIKQCKQILTELLPDITVQSADVFPRIGVIVDSVNSFLGLDASVCIFILSNACREKSVHPLRRIFQRRTMQCEMNMYNPRYEVFLASRATHKAVFVVPELHEDLVHQMKFDHFQVCVRMLIYCRLTATYM